MGRRHNVYCLPSLSAVSQCLGRTQYIGDYIDFVILFRNSGKQRFIWTFPTKDVMILVVHVTWRGCMPNLFLLLLTMSVYEITHEKDASLYIGPSVIFSWYLISPGLVGIVETGCCWDPYTPQKLILSKFDFVTETGDGHYPSLSHRT